MTADPPVEELHLGLRVRRAVDASQAHEAPSVDELVFDARQSMPEGREREVVATEVEDVVGLGQRVPKRRIQLGLLRVIEVFGPRLLVGHVRRGPLALWFEDARGVAHGTSVPISRLGDLELLAPSPGGASSSASRLAMSWRLSYWRRPLPSAISTLARPSLK